MDLSEEQIRELFDVSNGRFFGYERHNKDLAMVIQIDLLIKALTTIQTRLSALEEKIEQIS